MEENEEIFNLEEIKERFEEKGFFRRMGDMFKGFKMPHNTREYKEALIELQRLAAPIIAFVSVTLFVGVLMVVTAISGQKKQTIEVQIAEVEDIEDIQEETQEEEVPEDIETPPQEELEIQVDTPTPNSVVDVTPPTPQTQQQVSVKPAPQDTVAFVDSPIKMKSMVGSRDPGAIGAATSGGAGYGDAVTEATVLKVLWWLSHKQDADGSWKGGSNALANTALAVLTYLAHGEYPGSPSPYQAAFGPVVQQAVDFLCNSVKVNGDKVTMAGVDGNEYAFLIATYALCEAYGMTKNPNCKDVAMQCLTRIVKGQSPTGGWDYKINPKSTRDDMSFAGWALQALKAGKMAGLHPDGLDECIKKAIHCLKTRNFSKGGFNYTAGGGPTGLTATGCLAMQLLGFGNQPEVKSALEWMKEWQPTFDKDALDPKKKPGGSPQYYCYYATQCKYQAGMKQGASKGDEVIWQKWNAAMKKVYPKSIIELQEKVTDKAGKQHKMGYFKNSDQFSTRPVMDSCLVALQLMVYYRYLPTAQLKATETEDKDGASAAVDKGEDVDVVVDI